MKQPKAFYRDLTHAGYNWGGFWDGKHHFVKKVPTGYMQAAVIESDIADGSWAFMCENGLSR